MMKLALQLLPGWIVAALGLMVTVPGMAGATPARPNIVFILADDLGWRDLRCYGSAWHDTPNLDRLAREGVRFTQAYASAPICSASRASILTGKSPARLGFEFVTKEPTAPKPMVHALETPSYPLNLPLEEITLGEVIGPAGYATGYFGKWHVSQHYRGYLGWSPTHGPFQQGYVEGAQEFGSHPYGDQTRPEAERGPLPVGDYGRDALTERAIEFLRAHRTEPFFLHLAHYYVHVPVRTRATWLQQKYAARLPADAGEGRAAYGAMVETLDHLVGEVLRELDQLGLARRTLVIFTSDNGGQPEYAANGPLRGGKWNLYEGGIRVPWIVRWPGRVKAGTVNDTPIIGSDLLPTFCDVAGTAPPAGVPLDGKSLVPLLTGHGLAPRAQPLVWHFPYYHPEPEKAYASAIDQTGVNDFKVSKSLPHSAIRAGDYKLIHFYESGRDELYRVSDDLSEQNDLSAREPERTRELRARLDAYLRDVHARLPSPPSAAAGLRR